MLNLMFECECNRLSVRMSDSSDKATIDVITNCNRLKSSNQIAEPVRATIWVVPERVIVFLCLLRLIKGLSS